MNESKLFTLAEATRRIATCCINPGDTTRQTEDRVRKRIRYAVDTGELRCLPGNRFEVKALLKWASDKWPTEFDDSVLTGIPTPRPRSLSTGLSAILFPPDDRIEDALAEAYERIAELEAENAALRQELEALRTQRNRPYPRF